MSGGRHACGQTAAQGLTAAAAPASWQHSTTHPLQPAARGPLLQLGWLHERVPGLAAAALCAACLARAVAPVISLVDSARASSAACPPVCASPSDREGLLLRVPGPAAGCSALSSPTRSLLPSSSAARPLPLRWPLPPRPPRAASPNRGSALSLLLLLLHPRRLRPWQPTMPLPDWALRS